MAQPEPDATPDPVEQQAVAPDAAGETVEEPQEAQAKLIIGKQRNGPTGTLDLYFVKHYTRFESVAAQFADDSPF